MAEPGRPEEILFGILALGLSLLLVKRVTDALRTGDIPLYRVRMRREDLGAGRFGALVVLNLAMAALLLFGALDLLLQWGLF